MPSWFTDLDDLLRGRKTGPDRLAEDRVDLPLHRFVTLAVILGGAYGFFMGWYSVFNRDPVGFMQLIAAMVKLPALFLLTLLVTFPSLYVFNALVGCRLSMLATVRLLVGAIVVNVAVAASLGPILGFFTLSTTSYSFMIVLNVVLLAIGGIVGLAFLLHTLRRLAAPQQPAPPSPPPQPPGTGSGSEPPHQLPGPLEKLAGDVPEQALGTARMIFKIWVVLYALVGAQMGWLLRPFVGTPDLPFSWFRGREGNFFLSVLQQLENLFTAG